MTTAKYVQLGGNSFKINSLAKQAISTFFAVIFFFALGAIVDTMEASGQCKTGFTPDVVTFSIGDCNYTLFYCFRCAPSGGNPNNMYPYRLDVDEQGCSLTNEEVENKINEVLFLKYLQICSHNPCSAGVNIFTVIKPMCGKLVNVPNPGLNYH